MKQNFYSTLGTSYAKDKQLIKKIMSNPNVFVGWVDSYDEATCSVNVQPAMQRENVDENSVADYVNRPYLNNVYIVSNTLSRNPQRGDKALILVLDEKSNAFFKAQYDEAKALQDQTFVNTSNSVKTLSNCVAIIIQPNKVGGKTYTHNIRCFKFDSDGFDFAITLQTSDDTKFTPSTLQTYLANKLGVNNTKQVCVNGYGVDEHGKATGNTFHAIVGNIQGLLASGYSMTTMEQFAQVLPISSAYVQDTVIDNSLKNN